MSPPLDESYLTWLYAQVDSVRRRSPSRTYWQLLRQLYTKEFVWFIPNDDNRVEDGRLLRYEFLESEKLEADHEWLGLGCSMLEMLIGLSRRLSFEAWDEPREWFWILLRNLGLNELNDATNYDMEEVDETLDRVIWRTYNRNGKGGLFPLQRARKDQRDVEIWYQLSEYVLEGSTFE